MENKLFYYKSVSFLYPNSIDKQLPILVSWAQNLSQWHSFSKNWSLVSLLKALLGNIILLLESNLVFKGLPLVQPHGLQSHMACCHTSCPLGALTAFLGSKHLHRGLSVDIIFRIQLSLPGYALSYILILDTWAVRCLHPWTSRMAGGIFLRSHLPKRSSSLSSSRDHRKLWVI